MDFIYENTAYYEAFPANIEVQIAEQDKRHLFPIGIIKKDGVEILIAIPLFDEEGTCTHSAEGSLALGEFNSTYSKKGAKWGLDADKTHWSIPNPESSRWYQKVFPAYTESKEFFQKNKFLQYPVKQENPKKYKVSLFVSGHFAVSDSNWYSYLPKSINRNLVDVETEFGLKKKVEIMDHKGSVFEFIGSVEAFHYIAPITAYLFYFYEPKSKTVLVIASYS